MDRVIEFDLKGIESQNLFESILIDVALSIQNEAPLELTQTQWNVLRCRMIMLSELQVTFELGGYVCFFSKPDRLFTMTHVETNKHQTLYIYYSH